MEIGNIIHHFWNFCSAFNWEGADIWSQIGIGKSFSDISNATYDHGICTRTFVRPADVLLGFRKPCGAAMATIGRPYCTLLEGRCHDVCFEHAQSARCGSAFYAIPQQPMVMPLGCCRDACNRTACTSAICIFLGRCEIAMRKLLWCNRGLS